MGFLCTYFLFLHIRNERSFLNHGRIYQKGVEQSPLDAGEEFDVF